MSTLPPVKVIALTAAEICGRVYLDKQALQLLRAGMKAREFVEALVQNEQRLAAIDFVAHAVPPREAIWWGCLCLQQAFGDKLAGWESTASRAVVRWVLQPTEANRAAAKHPADVLGLASPAGALAVAASQTGGSIAPPNMPTVPPSLYAPARAVAISIKVASTKVEATAILPTQRAFIELGMGVAEGRFTWDGVVS